MRTRPLVQSPDPNSQPPAPPWRNRVTPCGDIVAVGGRGTLTGNRGVLIDADRRLVRDSQVRRWIACELTFRGRQRAVMTPGKWTELFFLDEATALAAGHRPCAECRNADYRAFQAAWQRAFPAAPVHAAAMDAVLHAERRLGPWRKRTYRTEIGDLPDGTYVALDGAAWLVRDRVLCGWSDVGYRSRRPRPDHGEVTVLTPPSIVAVLGAAYRVRLHPSAMD
ncbi:MAG TPA: hypothetical protein VGQ62_02740 [Chloroflexota bacterium]|nr:hypothetical protein [Chloroflexota bacterium]